MANSIIEIVTINCGPFNSTLFVHGAVGCSIADCRLAGIYKVEIVVSNLNTKVKGKNIKGKFYNIHVAAINCGKYFFQNAHCLKRGPRPMLDVFIPNSKYCLPVAVCIGQSGNSSINPGLGLL